MGKGGCNCLPKVGQDPSPASVDEAATVASTTPAEVAAVLRLSYLEDESLALIAKNVPPKTTWLELGDSSPEGIAVAMAALSKRSKGVSATKVIETALMEFSGASPLDRLRNLGWEHLATIHKRACDYNMFREKDRIFLRSLVSRVKRFREPPSLGQLSYLESLVTQMKVAGVLTPRAGDPDRRFCDEILTALQGNE